MKSNMNYDKDCPVAVDNNKYQITRQIKHDMSVQLNKLMETEIRVFDKLMRCLNENEIDDKQLLIRIQICYANRLYDMRSLINLWYEKLGSLEEYEVEKLTHLLNIIQHRYQNLKKTKIVN